MVRILPKDREAFKIPKPSGPAFRISFAKTAKMATAPPKSTAIMSKVSAPKITLLEKTNCIPETRLSFIDSFFSLFMIGFFLIKLMRNKEIMTKRKTNPNV